MVVRKTYERFGLETNFEQLQYSQSVMFEKKIYFISSSDEYDSDFINYNITIYIVPEVKMLKKKTILKKCFIVKSVTAMLNLSVMANSVIINAEQITSLM